MLSPGSGDDVVENSGMAEVQTSAGVWSSVSTVSMVTAAGGIVGEFFLNTCVGAVCVVIGLLSVVAAVVVEVGVPGSSFRPEESS